jgi:hypothetical protein
LLNRTVFHPRGFALAHDAATGEFNLYGDGTEPWHFVDGGGMSEDEKFAAFETLLQIARERNGGDDR